MAFSSDVLDIVLALFNLPFILHEHLFRPIWISLLAPSPKTASFQTASFQTASLETAFAPVSMIRSNASFNRGLLVGVVGSPDLRERIQVHPRIVPALVDCVLDRLELRLRQGRY